jgi:hypothetical protein
LFDIVVVVSRRRCSSFVNLTVDGQRPLGLLRRRPPRRPTASIHWDFLSSTSSSTANVRWTFFVNLAVDGQSQLDLP